MNEIVFIWLISKHEKIILLHKYYFLFKTVNEMEILKIDDHQRKESIFSGILKFNWTHYFFLVIYKYLSFVYFLVNNNINHFEQFLILIFKIVLKVICGSCL